jgi:pimeloyl-ACP methyl ester carboxylesterase
MRRNLLRVVLVIAFIIFILPLLIPLPPVGVDAATLADPDGFFIEVNGLSTYVLARGPEAGIPVVMLHGWGASTFSWRNQIDVLATAGYRAIAFDRPPYGLSTKTGANIPMTPGDLADFTAATLDALGIEQAVIIGQSQGGGVAGYFAVRYPERVSSLVWVAAALRPTDDPAPTGSGGTGSRVGGALGLPPFVNELLQIPSFSRWAQLGIRAFVTPDFSINILRSAYYDPALISPEIIEGSTRQLRVTGWDEALLSQLRGGSFSPEPLLAEEITGISVLVLIIWGAEDSWVPLSVGERLHELLPESTLLAYPNVGHLPQEENPARFNADLLAFLAASSPEDN